MSRCTVHGLNVECGPSSFRILELLSNGTGLPKTCMLAFYCLVSVWETIVWWIWWWIGFGRVLNYKFHLGIVFILVVCFTRVPYVVNKCFVIAACFQQHLSLIILGLSWEKVKKFLYLSAEKKWKKIYITRACFLLTYIHVGQYRKC